MQNDDILSIMSVIYNVARDLDQKGQGAASISPTNISSEEIVKYNILNILSYLCACSNENDLNIDVISDIIGFPVTYSDCVDAALSSNIDISILSNLPLSFVVMVNADKANSVTLLEKGSEEKSYAYTLFLIYQMIFTRFYKNCTVDELKVKNEPLYNFLLGISHYICDNLKTMMSYYNPESGTIDAPNFRIDIGTGNITINPSTSSNKHSRRNRSTSRLPSESTTTAPSSPVRNDDLPTAPIIDVPSTPVRNDEPSMPAIISATLPPVRKKPSIIRRIFNSLSRLF